MTGTRRADLAGYAAREFAGLYGAPPAGVWSAPGRVNLMGEHTDYNAGLCLPIALPHRTFAAAAARDDGRFRVHSAQEGASWEGSISDVGPGQPVGWAAYVAGVPWAMAEAVGTELPGLDLWVDGHVPVGAGLSSSAALECAVAVALDDLAGLGLATTDGGRARLAAACDRAENVVAQAPTGGMDQAASLRCTEGHALLLDCRDRSVEQVPLDIASHWLAWLVIDTRAAHQLVDGQYGERRATCEAAAALLGLPSLREVPADRLDAALARLPDDVMRRRVRHVVTEIERVRQTVMLLRAGRVAELGPVLDASHLSMRDDYEISCEELDLAVESACAAGALGARMTGGGFGGSAIALVPEDRQDDIGQAVESAFAAAGFTAPGIIRAYPAGGAGRDL
ncbi:MAG: galactokinase [Actinomycetales bacterium]